MIAELETGIETITDKLTPGRYTYELADGTLRPFEILAYRPVLGEECAIALFDYPGIGHGYVDLLPPRWFAISKVEAVESEEVAV